MVFRVGSLFGGIQYSLTATSDGTIESRKCSYCDSYYCYYYSQVGKTPIPKGMAHAPLSRHLEKAAPS